MDSNAETFEDCFNLLCGGKIGEGCYRSVYACNIRPDLVVKVENQQRREFANVLEYRFWEWNRDHKKVADWLAPIEFISPDGRILLMRKVRMLHQDDRLPEKLPAFLTDVKLENFGWIDGRIVSVDYASTIMNPSTTLRKAYW